MFYWFYEDFNINIFQYITVRASIAFFLAFLFTFFLMPRFLKWAKNKDASQPIYDLAPQSHQKKQGTPTMGGIVFVLSTIFATLLTAKLYNLYVIGGVVTILLFSLIGVKDDYLKISTNKNSQGMSAKAKLLYQIIVSLIVISILIYLNHTTTLYIPFYKYPLFDMNLFAILFWVLIMLASTNAVNLTDGLDGLATVPSIFAFLSLGSLIYITGHAVISSYLLLPNIKLVGELTIVVASFIGALIGFLWYNSHPAEVFMGDSGSLAIGGFLGYLSIVAKSEVLLLLIGFIFVFETISVILQVGSFKLRKKRVFLMAPIHHHFEQKGWHENKVIVRFWIIAFITNLIALASLKIR